MRLIDLQAAFLAEIAAADDAGAPSSTGMAIYRDAYRGRLLGALETSFERTRRWTGAESFTAAAGHYVLSTPPTGWSLDDYGDGLPALLAELFADDPEVAELAWLEWQMQRAFAAPDAPTLDAATLAASASTAEDWDRLAFTLAAGFATRAVAHDCVALWQALDDDAGEGGQPSVTPLADAFLVVWRQHASPRYRIVGGDEFAAIGLLALGGTLGDLARSADATRLTTWLAQWLEEGLFAAAAVKPVDE